jgi:hypothetical protein
MAMPNKYSPNGKPGNSSDYSHTIQPNELLCPSIRLESKFSIINFYNTNKPPETFHEILTITFSSNNLIHNATNKFQSLIIVPYSKPILK